MRRQRSNYGAAGEFEPDPEWYGYDEADLENLLGHAQLAGLPGFIQSIERELRIRRDLVRQAREAWPPNQMMQATDRPPEPEEEEAQAAGVFDDMRARDIQLARDMFIAVMRYTYTPGDDIFRDGVTLPQIRRAAEKAEAIVKGDPETMAQLETKFENMPPRLFVQIATLLLPEFVRKQDELTLKAQQPVPLAPPSGEGGHGFSSAGAYDNDTQDELEWSRFRINAGHLPPDLVVRFWRHAGYRALQRKTASDLIHLRGALLNLFRADPTNSELQQDIQLVDREISTRRDPDLARRVAAQNIFALDLPSQRRR